MLNYQKIFCLAKTEIHISDINEFNNPVADELEILLDKSLLHIEQFTLNKEGNISEEEQILWQINATLPQPLESYFYAYQIYTNEEYKIQGLFCVIEKEVLEKITSVTNQRIKIYSADRQFLLYENKIPVWQIESYVWRLLNISKIFLCGILAICLIALPILFFCQQNLNSKNTALQTEKENLLQQLKNLRQYEREQNLADKNKSRNQSISDYLYTFSMQIPEQVYFRKLTYAAENVQIDGFCLQDKELKALQKTLKTESILKPELVRLSKEDFIHFSLRTDLTKLLEKEIKNVRLAKK